VAYLALFDLDNTLLDREAAFATWGQGFIESNRLSPESWSAIEKADEDGLKPRDLFFSQLQEELGISTGIDDLVGQYDVEYPACYSVEGETIGAIRSLRANGWKVGVVTNGPPSQWAKLKATSMVEEFDAICISSVVGARKPDIAIFEAAARICEAPLEGWMVGDSAVADIGGGRRAGLRTIWMARGRVWRPSDPAPDAVAETIPEAVSIILR
jgi:FMN phosphatase YigB (HAD superfamily)